MSVEAARSGDRIRVCAVEKNPAAVELLRQNRRKFRTDGIRIVEGEGAGGACRAGDAHPYFYRRQFGQPAGDPGDSAWPESDVRIVINAISLETLTEAMRAAEDGLLADPEITQITAARSRELGRYHMMTGQNPVYIISAGGKRSAGKMHIPRILIAAPASGSGKTAVTCALLAALKARGFACGRANAGPIISIPCSIGKRWGWIREIWTYSSVEKTGSGMSFPAMGRMRISLWQRASWATMTAYGLVRKRAVPTMWHGRLKCRCCWW